MSLDLSRANDFDTVVKLALYGITAESGRIPAIAAAADRVRATPAAVKEAYLRLRARRLLWLEADGNNSGSRRISSRDPGFLDWWYRRGTYFDGNASSGQSRGRGQQQQ